MTSASTKVIFLDEEIMSSAAEEALAKKAKSALQPPSTRLSKAIVPYSGHLIRSPTACPFLRVRVGTSIELESTHPSLKERNEELTSAKETLAAVQQKCLKLCEESQKGDVEHAKKYTALEAELAKPKGDHASLVKDTDDSHSATEAETKRADDAVARALKAEEKITQWEKELEQWVARRIERFLEGMSVATPEVGTPAEGTETEAGETEDANPE
ncbi:hypothetical protein LIER_35491 [Lithospermum erythrorhizon]|uniref:Uncharacterized protein n=1 Tax=Lithospermum erythrorhizon TaxID=34254 RepID=A0AAV3NRM2_LITER